jgi:hypothetical protein
VNFLSKKAGVLITKDKLQEINKRFNTDFENTMNSILDNKYQYNDGASPTPIQSDLLILYGLRNRGAHGLSSVPICWRRIRELRRAIINSLFLAAEVLH